MQRDFEAPPSADHPAAAADSAAEAFAFPFAPVTPPSEAVSLPADAPAPGLPTEGWAEASEAEGDAAQTTPTPASAPRGSRNMLHATLVGVGLLLGVLFAAWWHPLALTVVVYAFCIAGAVEWARALGRQGRHIPLVPIIVAILGMAIATWYAKPEGLVIALLVGCAGVVAWRLSDDRVANTLPDSLAAMLTLMWIPFLASFVVLMELADDGWKRVLILVLAVVGNDTGGLLFGSLFGRHKMLPRVSPGKTWEGFAGGVLVGTLAASVASYLVFEGRWYIGAAVGFAATLAAVVGDLAESAIKRDMKVKDMSSALPGHGGIMDRLDSIVFAAPVAYVVFAIFLGTLGTL